MNHDQWNKFLTDYNRELLSYAEVLERLPSEVIRSNWLGFSGASESEITTLEARLGTQLPPSFHTFLTVSNGWLHPSPFIPDLLPASKISRFRNEHQAWIDAYSGEDAPVPDSDYLVYGENQDSVQFRAEYLHTAIAVSSLGDSAIILLNPRIVTPDGEWETWLFANWLPGARRYQSFADWLKDERKSCAELYTPAPIPKAATKPKSKPKISAKQACALARKGQTAEAIEALEPLAQNGDAAAAASLAELYAFLGEWEMVITNAAKLIANPTAVYAGNVFDAMIRLLGRAGHRSNRWDRIEEITQAAMKASDQRDYGIHGEHIRSRYDTVFRNLIEYAHRQGQAPHELVAIFGVKNTMDEMSKDERENWYSQAVKSVDSNRPDLKKNPHAKAEYFFSLARGVKEEEALNLYTAHSASFRLWDPTEYVASVHARRGNPEAAWAVIQPNLGKWWPVDNSQVTPIALLTDEYLSTLMTPERCQLVLSTPRGPEGANNSKT